MVKARTMRIKSIQMKLLGSRMPGIAIVFVLVILMLTALSGFITLFLLGAAVSIFLARSGWINPSLSFGLLTCLLYPSTGLAYFGVMGYFPGGADPNFIYLSYAFFFVGIGLIMVGYRFLGHIFGGLAPPHVHSASIRLFAVRPRNVAIAILVVYLPEWLGIRLGGPSFGGFSQILNHTLAFRQVIIAYYILTVFNIRDYRSIVSCCLICLYVAIPASTSSGSGWSHVIIFLAIVSSYALTAYRVDAVRLLFRRPLVLLMSFVALCFLIFFGLVWEGGLKSDWRSELRRDGGGNGTFERLINLSDQFSGAARNLDTGTATERLTARMSSGQAYFSYVISRKRNASWDHTWGELTLDAVGNLVPRIIWPDKPNLGGDSWLVRNYAGLRVAGNKEGTSIGLGFIPQFYIEAGVFGIVFGCFTFGILFALSHRALRRASHSDFIGDTAFIAIIASNALTYDANYIKLLNSIIYQSLIFSILLIVLRSVAPLVWARRSQRGWARLRFVEVPRSV